MLELLRLVASNISYTLSNYSDLVSLSGQLQVPIMHAYPRTQQSLVHGYHYQMNDHEVAMKVLRLGLSWRSKYFRKFKGGTMDFQRANLFRLARQRLHQHSDVLSQSNATKPGLTGDVEEQIISEFLSTQSNPHAKMSAELGQFRAAQARRASYSSPPENQGAAGAQANTVQGTMEALNQ